ncbi:hypothetical protein VTL71DRAFT_7484 [Oculimacula yallundae]|uniref:Peptidase S54 rhomboid domain-containing protein n=1 Tax=Oculimacula yallundae TaxID=86028 RepID=A0ABR4BUB4_9HELO
MRNLLGLQSPHEWPSARDLLISSEIPPKSRERLWMNQAAASEDVFAFLKNAISTIFGLKLAKENTIDPIAFAALIAARKASIRFSKDNVTALITRAAVYGSGGHLASRTSLKNLRWLEEPDAPPAKHFADWYHLAVNMFSLWRVGPKVTRCYGLVQFIVIWLGSSLCGSLLHAIHWACLERDKPEVENRAIGASCSVLGLVTILACGEPYKLVQVPFIPQEIPAIYDIIGIAVASQAALEFGLFPQIGHLGQDVFISKHSLI